MDFYPFCRNFFKLVNRGLKVSAVNPAYSIIKGPIDVQDAQEVPISIDRPPYAETGIVPPSFERIKSKTPEEIELMRDTCATTRKLLWILKHRINVWDLNFFAFELSFPKFFLINEIKVILWWEHYVFYVELYLKVSIL